MTAREFTVYPALDVLEGRCVRLAEGVRERVTIEGGNPETAARRFAEEGARWLHLVDLDGAFAGQPTEGLVARIAAAAPDVPLQVGGGYRTVEAIETGLAAGATRVMVGTAAAAPDFLRAAAERFGERLVVAIDVKDGRVALRGWTDVAELAPEELAARCADAGVKRLLVTNTRRDGSLTGPDTELLGRIIEAGGLPVIAAGGVSSLADLEALHELGCEGAIAGAALWSGRFTLAEALGLHP
jgi:phosphoribosylformimino-5-aminoimidazole carboxamide ribotide isomerase